MLGMGAFLAVSPEKFYTDSFKTRAKVKRFEQTSSTRLELQTLVWALTMIRGLGGRIIIFPSRQGMIVWGAGVLAARYISGMLRGTILKS